MINAKDTFEAESPGQTATAEQWQMLCCRYYTAAQFVQGKTALEVGCGPGIGLGYLLGKGAKRVVGGDLSENNVRLAQNHYKGTVNLAILDAQSLPFKNACFDEIVLFEAIYYLSRPDKFFTECRRVLRNNGILIMCLANKDLPGFRSSPLSTKYFSAPELHAMLSQHNFKVEIFGAFPIRSGTIVYKIKAGTILIISKVLNYLPAGRKLKYFLNKTILGKIIIIKEEVLDEDIVVQDLKLTPLRSNIPNFSYKILYALAHPITPNDNLARTERDKTSNNH
jgi:SAM-dependent methyltransferase